MLKRKKTLGLALGGGAVRGFAHLGVLKVLEEIGIKPDYVAGTSAGSLIGALYCAGRSWKEIAEKALDADWRDFVRATLPSKGIVKADGLEKIVEEFLGDPDFTDLKTPFAAVAVDLTSGRQKVFRDGAVARAVRASCSIPGIFVPYTEGDAVYVDGGVLNSVPADVVRGMGADYVIAVDLNDSPLDETVVPKNIVEVVFRSFMIMMRTGTNQGARSADLLIRPDLEGFSYIDMSRKEELIERGENAMLRGVPKIARKLTTEIRKNVPKDQIKALGKA